MIPISRTVRGALFTLTSLCSAVASAGIDISTSLTGLRYHVLDLDPHDGITAAVTFTGGSPLFNLVDVSQPQGMWGKEIPVMGQPFAAQPVSFDGGQGFATGQANARGYSLSAQVPTSQLLNAQAVAAVQTRLEQPYTSGAQLHLAGAKAYTSLGAEGIRWSLTPGTALVIEGQIGTTYSMDLSDLDKQLLEQSVTSKGHEFSAHAYAFTGLVLSKDNMNWQADPQTYTSSASSGLVDHDISWGPQGQMVVQDKSVSPTPSKAFTLSLSNTGHTAATGELSFSSMLFASSQISVPFDQMASNVPEPDAWAMMGLGLLGVATITRRRRAGSPA